MQEQTQPFSSRLEFQEQLRACCGRARVTLQLFDPDFALWELGGSAMDAVLRRFLAGGGRIMLAAHANGALERHAARFMRLLRDYPHAIECRLTDKRLRQLTDSFCLADGRDLVRRFHADHLRGAAVWGPGADAELYSERFAAIWAETLPGLQASVTGL